MVGTKKRVANRRRDIEKPAASPSKSKALVVAGDGINTGMQFAKFMSALMTDVIEGAVAPGTCNAACNAGGKLLRIVELQLKYGMPVGSGRKDLVLTVDLANSNGKS